MARTTAGRMTLDPQRLPQIVRAPRSGPGLQPTALTADPEVLGLNISRGCAHRCAFCSIRGSRYYDGDRELVLYDDTVGRLTSELDARPRLPRAVFVSPSTDPFPPFAEVQE